jgi:hypothetical protein
MTRQSILNARLLLTVDGAVSGATGLVMAAGAAHVAPALDLPPALLRYAGAALLPFAALVLHFARLPAPSRARVWAVVALNVAWVAGSALVLIAGVVTPNALGLAFVIFQALVVALLAELQYLSLRTGLPRGRPDRRLDG